MVPKGGFARLSLAPRAIRCGVPQGAHLVREWGRPSMAPAIAAGFGTFALPCVAHRGHSWFIPEVQVRSVPAQRLLEPVQIFGL